MDKFDTIILPAFFTLILIGMGIALLMEYVSTNNDAVILANAPKASTPGMITEYEKSVCWITGILKTENPNQLLTSAGAEKQCVFYSYIIEHLEYDTDSDGNSTASWVIWEEKRKFANIPVSVNSEKYTLQSDELRVEGGLVETIDKSKEENERNIEGTWYRYSEYIIPDGALVHVLGIPEKKAIKPSALGLLVTMKTIDDYIDEKVSCSRLFLLFSIVAFIGAFILFGAVVYGIRKEA